MLISILSINLTFAVISILAAIFALGLLVYVLLMEKCLTVKFHVSNTELKEVMPSKDIKNKTNSKFTKTTNESLLYSSHDLSRQPYSSAPAFATRQIQATAELHHVNDSTHQYENGSFVETESPQSDTNTESNHEGKTTIELLYEKQIPN